MVCRAQEAQSSTVIARIDDENCQKVEPGILGNARGSREEDQRMNTRDLHAERTWWPAARVAAVGAILVPGLALTLAGAAWASALLGLDLRQINDYGLVSVLPPAYFVALALVTLSFGWALNNRLTPSWLLLLHIVFLILFVYGTPSLAYDTLRYSWAWKHVGIVDYIQRWGMVDPSITSLADLSAYHNWPGFFALGALLTQAGGFASALQFAGLAPLFFNIVDIGPLWLIASALVRDRRLRWLALWFFFLANWIGQDYFAPQALGYFFFLAVIGVTLAWFSTRPRAAVKVGGRWDVQARLEAFWYRLLGPERSDTALAVKASPGQRLGLMALIVLLLGVVASIHQLTPFMVILALGALAVAYRISARTLPVLMAVITATWMLYMAWAFVGGNLTWIIHSFGRLDRNSTVTDLAHLSQGQVVVALAARGLTLLIGVLGIAGAVRRWRWGQRDVSFMFLAVAPLPMVFANSYSGEITFRIYFFALPFVAVLAAGLLYPSPAASGSRRVTLALVGLSVLLLAGLLLAYYGRERMNYFTPEEVTAARYLYNTAPPKSLVVGIDYDYPSVFTNYEQYTHVTLTGQSITKSQLERLRDDPVTAVTRVMSDPTYAATYLIITRSQKAHIEMDSILPAGTVDQIEQALLQSDEYKVIYQNQDATIMTLASQREVAR